MFIIKKKAEETVAQLTFHGYSGNDIREDIVGSYIFESFDSNKIGDYKKLLEKARLLAICVFRTYMLCSTTIPIMMYIRRCSVR